jgi:hypothetical protein
MKTTRRYELINSLGREDFSILVVKRSQANYKLEEQYLPNSVSVNFGRKAEEDDDSNHHIL